MTARGSLTRKTIRQSTSDELHAVKIFLILFSAMRLIRILATVTAYLFRQVLLRDSLVSGGQTLDPISDLPFHSRGTKIAKQWRCSLEDGLVLDRTDQNLQERAW